MQESMPLNHVPSKVCLCLVDSSFSAREVTDLHHTPQSRHIDEIKPCETGLERSTRDVGVSEALNKNGSRQGRLRCLGTSVRLKNRFGAGQPYSLITKPCLGKSLP